MSTTIDTSRYQNSLYTGNSAKETASAAKSASISTSAISNAINMEDFLVLMVAQLQNQTMYDTVDNSEMLAQLAQYSSIQAMTEMASSMTSVVEATNESLLMNYTSYAASLVGKEVTAAEVNESGELVETTGVVSGVGLFEGNPVIYIGDKAFDLGNIMVIGKAPATSTPDTPDTPDTDTDAVEGAEGAEESTDTENSETTGTESAETEGESTV